MLDDNNVFYPSASRFYPSLDKQYPKSCLIQTDYLMDEQELPFDYHSGEAKWG